MDIAGSAYSHIKLERQWKVNLCQFSRAFKGHVIGKGGYVINDIRQRSGARIISVSIQEEGFTVLGVAEQVACAKRLILQKVHGANLLEISNQTGAEVTRKGKEVHIVSGTEQQREQAKLNIGMRVECSNNDTSYLSDLARAALESFHMIKRERKGNECLEADMWCHFGTAIIRGPNEEEAYEGKWNIGEGIAKFQASAEGNYWKVAFKEGVDIIEDIFKGIYCEKTPGEYLEYMARYDLTFLTPCGYEVRCKVWVAKENAKKKLEDIPIPFSDVKNILDEIHFEDGLTRSRCRGWLVFPSRRYLQADILFPGCEFDCRLTIRGRAGKGVGVIYSITVPFLVSHL
ncbi:hypothetical protein OS493_034940 [Desmophyllum pertusum]|uniref:K Homology domain-containing protein n=1 Tax=Desmophyllum pertusum TaxID=174260 RepID=A0A9W9YWG3_9CNID|nr:hypothetical protein OS493_034940 [Desmophyllum pertusum]